MEVLVRCPLCGVKSVVTMPKDNYDKWQQGTLIQNAWPEGSVSDRELLVSGICKECQEDVFGI